MKAYWGSRGIAPRILDLGTRWKRVVGTPRLLYPQGKSPWHSLVRRMSGSQSRSGRCGEEKNSQPLLGLEPPIIQPVALRCSTDISWLSASLQLLPQKQINLSCKVKVKVKLSDHLRDQSVDGRIMLKWISKK
jgi:hypothetical protein